MEKCLGSRKEPRCFIQNDWFVGKAGVCAVCGRSFVMELSTIIPNHKASKVMEVRTSNCCGASVIGEYDVAVEDGSPIYYGRCSKCMDGAVFVTDEEFDALDTAPLSGVGDASFSVAQY